MIRFRVRVIVIDRVRLEWHLGLGCDSLNQYIGWVWAESQFVNKIVYQQGEAFWWVLYLGPYGAGHSWGMVSSWCGGSLDQSLLVDLLSYFLFQYTVLHNWCTKGHGTILF